MPHRLRALQAAEHILNAVKVMICSVDRIPLHVAGILTPDRDRVIAYLLIKFRTLPAARDQLRREVEIVCQLLFEQHMELLPHLGAHIVIPTRGNFDEPYNVRLVLRLQVCIVTRIKTHDTVRHIVIDRRIRHVLQHQPIQLKRELMAVAPANSGAIARIAAATAALKTVRACLRHKCQRIFHAPPLDEIRADRKRVGLLARAGEIEVRVRLRLQTGEIGNALLHRPGPDDRFGRRVHDLELCAVRHIRTAGPHGCPIVIADLIDEDRRFLGAAARRRINSIRCLSGRRQAHRVGIDPPRRFRRQREGRSRRRADHAEQMPATSRPGRNGVFPHPIQRLHRDVDRRAVCRRKIVFQLEIAGLRRIARPADAPALRCPRIGTIPACAGHAAPRSGRFLIRFVLVIPDCGGFFEFEGVCPLVFLRADHAGIDRDVVKQRRRIVDTQADCAARSARIIFKLFDTIDIANNLIARHRHAQPVCLSIRYCGFLLCRRIICAVLVRPPQKLRACFYAMIQPKMVKMCPICVLERHASTVSAAVEPLYQRHVGHNGIFLRQFARHRQLCQKSAALLRALQRITILQLHALPAVAKSIRHRGIKVLCIENLVRRSLRAAVHRHQPEIVERPAISGRIRRISSRQRCRQLHGFAGERGRADLVLHKYAARVCIVLVDRITDVRAAQTELEDCAVGVVLRRHIDLICSRRGREREADALAIHCHRLHKRELPMSSRLIRDFQLCILSSRPRTLVCCLLATFRLDDDVCQCLCPRSRDRQNGDHHAEHEQQAEPSLCFFHSVSSLIFISSYISWDIRRPNITGTLLFAQQTRRCTRTEKNV